MWTCKKMRWHRPKLGFGATTKNNVWAAQGDYGPYNGEWSTTAWDRWHFFPWLLYSYTSAIGAKGSFREIYLHWCKVCHITFSFMILNYLHIIHRNFLLYIPKIKECHFVTFYFHYRGWCQDINSAHFLFIIFQISKSWFLS